MEQERHSRDADQFQRIVEQSPDAFLINADGRIVYLNNAALRLFGTSDASQMLGHSTLEFIQPECHSAAKERIERVLNRREPVPPMDERWLTIDGTVIDLEVQCVPIDWDGKPAAQVSLRDVHSRKQAEAWLISLINATQDAVISIDREACIVMFNPAAEKIFGYSQAEVCGKKVNILMAEPYAAEHDQYIERYEHTGEKRAIGQIRTVAGRRKNGEIFPIELSVTQAGTGNDVQYAAFIRDISGKVKRERALNENSRLAAIGATVSKLVHEIGSPINGMYLCAQLLERRLENPASSNHADTRQKFSRLFGEIKRLNSLLGEFRAAARTPRYTFKPISLAAVVRDILMMERAHYITRGIVVDYDVSTDLPPVLADEDKLKQVILNLCNNAVEAMPSGGKLTLGGWRRTGHAILTINDTGNGIPDGIDIWGPFVTTKKTGTGLGLLIAKEIVDAHKGKIDYSSEHGKGTTFRLTLPEVSPSPSV